MELQFLWIEYFRKVRKQAFDFSPELNFTVTQKGPFQYSLGITVNPHFCNPYPRPLLNLTGIAGQNGSGKSTLLNCLKLLYGDLSNLIGPLIFCHFEPTTRTLHTHYFNGGGQMPDPLEVTLDCAPEVYERFNVLLPSSYQISHPLLNTNRVKGLGFEFEKLHCAYLSSNFDHTIEEYYNGIINVSTKKKLDKYLNSYIPQAEKKAVKESKQKEKKIPKIEFGSSHLREFYKEELQSNIKLITYANQRKRGSLPDLPREMVLTFNFNDFTFLMDEPDKPVLLNPAALGRIHELARRRFEMANDKRKLFKELLYLCIFYYAIRYDLFTDELKSSNVETVSDMLARLASTQGDIIEEVRRELEKVRLSQANNKDLSRVQDLLGPKLDKAIDKAPFDDKLMSTSSIVDFPFRIDANLWSLLSHVYDFQFGLDTTFLDYHWEHDLSTGEQARLNNYSRLYEIKRQIRGGFLLLLIDEGDLYYHPQWQKNYLNDLVDGLEFIFSNNNVQVIITTHSPFILSDIPRQNVIYLKRSKTEDGDVRCEVSDNEHHIQTFGANIHELFTDSFFLSNGLMGEFARSYIDRLIKEVKNELVISSKKFEENYKNRIGLVGDQFIKAKLLEMVARRVEADVVDQILEDRTGELAQLKRIRDEKRGKQP